MVLALSADVRVKVSALKVEIVAQPTNKISRQQETIFSNLFLNIPGNIETIFVGCKYKSNRPVHGTGLL